MRPNSSTSLVRPLAMRPRRVASLLLLGLVVFGGGLAHALQVIPFDDAVYRAMADCVLEARFEGSRDAEMRGGLAQTELVLGEMEYAVGACSRVPGRVVLPAWEGGQFWAGAPRLRPGAFYTFYLRVDKAGEATPLGLSEGIRPARVSGGRLEKFAFYRTREGLPWRWPEPEVTFHLHEGESGGLRYAEIAEAVEEALAMWSAPGCAGITLRLGEPWGGDVERFPEDVNSIALWDENLPVSNPAVIALTLHQVDEETGLIEQTWIVGNAVSRAWSVDGREDAFDVRGTLAHEIGHAIGFGHSEVREAVMFERIAASRSSAWRVLDEDDVEGLCELYPCADGPECAQPFPDPEPAAGAGSGVCGACVEDSACGGTRDVCLVLGGESGSGSAMAGGGGESGGTGGGHSGSGSGSGSGAGGVPSRAGSEAQPSELPPDAEGRCMRECGALLPCPEGFVCEPLLGERTLRQCVPVAQRCPQEEAFVCAPCVEDGDCGGPRGRCVGVGRDAFCAYGCADGLACPAGFGCEDAPAGAGGGQLCLPEGGVCPEEPKLGGGGCSAAGGGGGGGLPWVGLALLGMVWGRRARRVRACVRTSP